MFRAEAESPDAAEGPGMESVPPAGASPTGPEGVVAALQYGSILRTMAGLSDTAPADPALVHAAQVRIANLIDSGVCNFDELRAGADADALLAIAGLCADESHLALLLKDADSQRIASLVTDGSSSRIRQFAAQQVVDPEELRQLLKLVRGKDKSVYRIIKTKCDELRSEDQKSVQVENDAASACASLERHSHRIYDVVYEPTLHHFTTRWQAVELEAAPAIQERARHAIERCNEIIAEHARHVAQRAERQALEAAQRNAQAEALAREKEQALEREQTAAAAAAAEEQARRAAEQERAAKASAEGNAARRIAGLVARTHSALREGDTGRAAGLRRAVAESLTSMPAVPAHITRQVAQLDTKLNELKKWKDFAVAPKRAELIADMEALIGSSEPPKVLADRIKQLQEDWKVISKGIVSDSQADWERFHKAAETAYLPCRAYYEAQAKQRQANLQQRQVVLERLKNFEAAQPLEHPDWRAIAAVLREAPVEWRRYTPVERAALAKIQVEFDASLKRLQDRLDGWYAQNTAEKKSIIERARQLAAKTDHREAVDAAKHLQQLWQKIGVVERDQEQALWSEFREQCDAVFQRRQQAQVEFSAALDANKAAAASLCQEVERAAALDGADLFAAAARSTQWRSDFEAIGELPRNDQRALQSRFEGALRLIQTRVAEVRARDRRQSFDQLLESARHIQAFGYAVAQAAPDGERDALKLAAETFIAAVRHWPKGAAPLLKEAWQHAEAAASADLAANEKAYRTLCIRSEVFRDRATPPEDQALRREYQMQRLMQRMGQRSEEDSDAWETLALAWVRIGPIEADRYQGLLARFIDCR